MNTPELFLQWVIPDGQGQLANLFALSDGLALHVSSHLRGL